MTESPATSEDRAREHADAFAGKLAEATALDVGRISLGPAGDAIEVHVRGAAPEDLGGQPSAPHLLITIAGDPGIPTDEHGTFPWGVMVGAYDEQGELVGDESLLRLEPHEVTELGMGPVKGRVCQVLKDWKRGMEAQAARQLAERLAQRTGLHCEVEYTTADTGAVNAYLHRLDMDGGRHVQLTVHADALPPVDGAGGYPQGVAMTQINEHGDLTSVLWTLTPSDARDADSDAVEDAIVGHLRDWAKAHPDPERSRLARTFDRMGGVVVGDQLALAWGREQTGAAGPVRWIVALVRRESGELLDVVADTGDVSMLSVLVPVAAASVVRMKYPAPLAY